MPATSSNASNPEKEPNATSDPRQILTDESANTMAKSKAEQRRQSGFVLVSTSHTLQHKNSNNHIQTDNIQGQMVAIVHGFPNSIAALQFEWAWQKPHQSRHLKASAPPRKDQDIHTKLRVLADMLLVDQWSRWPLKVHFTSESLQEYFEALPGVDTMVSYGSLLELPFRRGVHDAVVQKFEGVLKGGSSCSLCRKAIDRS
ncbi:Structure-specific endonuclease subunit SLX1, partial [Rhizoclosmatium hyalinum]